MAASAPMKDMEEKFFQCTVCLDKLQEPKLLPCLHRFCEKCLQRMIQTTDKNRLICPLCREECAIPEDGVTGFKTDFYLKNMLEYVEMQNFLSSLQLGGESQSSSVESAVKRQSDRRQLESVSSTSVESRTKRQDANRQLEFASVRFMGAYGVKVEGFLVIDMTSFVGGGLVVTGMASDQYSFIIVTDVMGKTLRQHRFGKEAGTNWKPLRHCDTLSEHQIATVCQSNQIGIYDVRNGDYMKKNIHDLVTGWTPHCFISCIAVDPRTKNILVGSICRNASGQSRDVLVFDKSLNYLRKPLSSSNKQKDSRSKPTDRPRSRSPARRHSRSPEKRRSRSPDRKRSRSIERHQDDRRRDDYKKARVDSWQQDSRRSDNRRPDDRRPDDRRPDDRRTDDRRTDNRRPDNRRLDTRERSPWRNPNYGKERESDRRSDSRSDSRERRSNSTRESSADRSRHRNDSLRKDDRWENKPAAKKFREDDRRSDRSYKDQYIDDEDDFEDSKTEAEDLLLSINKSGFEDRVVFDYSHASNEEHFNSDIAPTDIDELTDWYKFSDAAKIDCFDYCHGKVPDPVGREVDMAKYLEMREQQQGVRVVPDFRDSDAVQREREITAALKASRALASQAPPPPPHNTDNKQYKKPDDRRYGDRKGGERDHSRERSREHSRDRRGDSKERQRDFGRDRNRDRSKDREEDTTIYDLTGDDDLEERRDKGPEERSRDERKDERRDSKRDEKREERKDDRRDDKRDDRHSSKEKKGTSRSPDRGGSKSSKSPPTVPPANTGGLVSITDILEKPGRFTRPQKIVIIIRGPPGSGKTFVAKLIKDQEAKYGSHTPRMLCIDDYFMTENEKTIRDPETGKMTKEKVLEYEYEAEMESIYQASLYKSFKKTIEDGFFDFIIVDAVNDKCSQFEPFWSFARLKGFEVYIVEMKAEAAVCAKRNVHNRTKEDIQQIIDEFEDVPNTVKQLDIRPMLQDAAITEVEMEDFDEEAEAEAKKKEEEAKAKKEEEELMASLTKSKWESVTEGKLDQLDGIQQYSRRRKSESDTQSQSLEDYLQLDDDIISRPTAPGQKRVRWADIEERKDQAHKRAIGFVVGQTASDWAKITDDNYADKALNRTKYI